VIERQSPHHTATNLVNSSSVIKGHLEQLIICKFVNVEGIFLSKVHPSHMSRDNLIIPAGISVSKGQLPHSSVVKFSIPVGISVSKGLSEQ
jgi:hypothetical protein